MRFGLLLMNRQKAIPVFGFTKTTIKAVNCILFNTKALCIFIFFLRAVKGCKRIADQGIKKESNKLFSYIVQSQNI
jgi:hypothetical protein